MRTWRTWMLFAPSRSKLRAKIWNMGVSLTCDHIKIKIKMANPSQEPPASSKAPNEDLKDIDFLCTFKIKIESKNSDHGCITNQWPYSNPDQDTKPQFGTSSVFQSPKWRLKGNGCSLHLQNLDRELKFVSWACQRPVTIFKSKSRCQTEVRNLQCPPKHQIRTFRTLLFFAPSKSKERTWVYPRRCQPPVRSLQHPPKL